MRRHELFLEMLWRSCSTGEIRAIQPFEMKFLSALVQRESHSSTLLSRHDLSLSVLVFFSYLSVGKNDWQSAMRRHELFLEMLWRSCSTGEIRAIQPFEMKFLSALVQRESHSSTLLSRHDLSLSVLVLFSYLSVGKK